MSDFPIPSGAMGGRTTVLTFQTPGQALILRGPGCVGSWRTWIWYLSTDGAAWSPHARVQDCGQGGIDGYGTQSVRSNVRGGQPATAPILTLSHRDCGGTTAAAPTPKKEAVKVNLHD